MTAITVGASAQVGGTFDRDFQRLDKLPKVGKNAKNPVSTPVMGYNLGAGYTFPDAVRSYYLTGNYNMMPMGAGNNQHSLQVSFTYDRSIPRFDVGGGGGGGGGAVDTASPAVKVDGPKSDNYFLTAQYQVTQDSNYAVTPGFSYGYSGNGGAKVYTPFVGAAYALATDIFLMPTLAWTRINVGGQNTDGFVPDLGVIYGPAGKKHAVSADYIVRTRVTLPTVFTAAKYQINDRYNVKFGVASSKFFNPAYIFGVYYKF